MKNGVVNILFACGYGLGSSALAEAVVKKALAKHKINSDLKHTALGEMSTMVDWTDILIISKKLAEGVEMPEGKHMIVVVNIMDGEGIVQRVGEIVDEHYPEARGE